ncbi:Mce protein [Mycobacterium sp. E740]|uniref:Mce protein n=1 Tax=Mycobacterium sp. E740 TaxID=1834149 RepID=UPI0007FD1E31|nr:Mce protein [Mycobacterium sp. E740]OBI73014.1 Mce protein [Mycobacterium sp. E740]
MADETTPAEEKASESTSDVDSAADLGESTAPAAEPAPEVDDVADYEAEDADETVAEPAPVKRRMSHLRLATIVGLVLVVGLGGLVGWLGYRAYESHKADQLQKLFLQVGRQGALNLTTINFEHADADVQRVLDSSTGTFYDDFQKRAGPFVEVVKQAQSKSEGKISEAGLESSNDNEGQVLVAVTVNTTNAGAPEQQPRAWRMRISVQKTGEDEAKVSNVEFVP